MLSVSQRNTRTCLSIALTGILFSLAAAPWGVTASIRPDHKANSTVKSKSQASSVVSPWQDSERNLVTRNDPLATEMDSFRNVHLDPSALEKQLARAPLEFAREKPFQIEITLPLPDGSLPRFVIEESPIMQADLAARLPNVRTYHGYRTDDQAVTTRFDWTPQGFHAIVLSDKAPVFVEPIDKDLNEYVTYTSNKSPNTRFECGVTDADVADAVSRGVYDWQKNGTATPDVTSGTTLRTYRLAAAATGEFVAQYGGGNVATAQGVLVTLMNLVDAVYEKEAAIRFTLIDNTAIVYPNAATDPYTSPNFASNAALNENQAAIDGAIGNAGYDVGHLFGSIDGLPPGFLSFSGLAQIGVVCTAGAKGKGVSTMGGIPATHAIFVSGVAHELAHQFSARHTFNTGQAPCDAQRDATTSYEVGSGSTIMAYSICGNDNLQPQNDLYFHVKSLEQILSYATTSGLCATTSATGNLPPLVTGPGDFSIPRNTPFALTAVATDASPLTYSWEEFDLGPNPTVGPYVDDSTVPLFRGYAPVASPTRLFPSLTYILNNANNPPGTYMIGATTYLTGELLPSTTRRMIFQVVVRDNQANGGGINTAMSTIDVLNTVGPFLVTAPNTNVSIPSQTATTITWSVNGTTANPVNVQDVRISLSTDGGNTFPTVLMPSTPNDGSEVVYLPNTPTLTARIKVEAINNIFFDISDADFTITSRVPSAGTASIRGRITDLNGVPVGGVMISLSGGASQKAITDGKGNYHFDNLDTGQFYTMTPFLANYYFSPANRSFSLVANQTDAGFTAVSESRGPRR